VNTDAPGTLVRIIGPIIEATGLAGAGMFEVVHVGDERLVGEVIRLAGDRATVQVYEETAGLQPGGPVFRTGAPLSVELGPGLVGGTYDGIQRPLEDIMSSSGAFIPRGIKANALARENKWAVTPVASVGQDVSAGDVLATIPESNLIEYRVLVPPSVTGKVVEILSPGEYTVNDTCCVIEQADGTRRDVGFILRWPVREAKPFRSRRQPAMPMITGQRVIDTLFPIARGGTACIPGGFGTGKTVTQQTIAKWAEADVIVYIGCGERGNEMTQVLREFPRLVDPRTGHSLMERTVLVANTSNMPVPAREVSIYTGITIAEHFRDMGYHVAVMADSTSRWAEALRELSGRLEEMPAEEGFPAYLGTRLAQFYERAGMVTTSGGQAGSVTIIGAVSPMSGDFAEPVTQHTRRFTRCFWGLDTELAYARHYPAISWLSSYSEYIDDVRPWWEKVDPEWWNLRLSMVKVLQDEARLQQIVKLVGPDILPESQRLTLLAAQIIKNGFLQQDAFDEKDMYSSPTKQVSLLRIMLGFHKRGQELISRGVHLADIRKLPAIEKIQRARLTFGNDELEGLEKLGSDATAQLDNLERTLL